jgi:hypothetical protein
LLSDLAEPGQDVRLHRRKLLVAHLSQLDAHLRREQLVAERRLVVQLRVDGSSDLVENEPQSADEQRVQDDQWARSSLSRMLTKLYGGQGPVYLNVNLS